MKKTAFVTGGSGFVGQNLIPFLIEKGYHIKALARSKASADIVARLGTQPIMGDLNNTEALTKGVNQCDSVFHLAASVDFFASITQLRDLYVTATKRLLDIT